MKLAVLKLLSLLTLAAGVFLFSFSRGCPYCNAGWETFMNAVGGIEGLKRWFPLIGGIMAVAGLYGFLPKLPKRAKNLAPTSISYELEHGEVQMDLKPIEERLKQVLIRMPEIKKISLKVTADEDAHRIRIASEVVLHSNVNVPARDIQNLINKYIVETATSIFGLEVVQPIKLVIRGISINPKAASKAVRAGVARGRETAAETATEAPCCMECAEAAAQALEVQPQPETGDELPVASEAAAPPEEEEKDPWG